LNTLFIRALHYDALQSMSIPVDLQYYYALHCINE